MSANGVKNFIAAVDLLFPAPQYGGDKARQAGWVALYTSELGGYPDDVLASVGKKIIRERKREDGAFFPEVSVIREMCEEKMESLRALPLLPSPDKVSYTARANLAADLMKSPLGKQATKDGWELSMFHFCVDHMRAPSGKEIEDCKRKSDEFKAEYEKCLNGERGNGRLWANIAEGIVRKAREAMEKSA